MKRLMVWLLAALVIAYSPGFTLGIAPLGLDNATVFGAEGIDYATQRNGMHSCPPGSFVTGIHANRNLLLCSTDFGEYLPGTERVDSSSQQKGWHPDGDESMHGCPSGAVTGIHAGGRNVLACAPLARGNLFVDKNHQRQGMHACPEGTVVVGLHVSRNRLLCGTFREVLSGREVQRNDMLSCPAGMYITGLHISKNKLLCSAELGRWQGNEVVDASTRIHATGPGGRGCPKGMAATGVHNARNLIACAPIAKQLTSRRPHVQRANMSACPFGSIMTGYDQWKSDPITGASIGGIYCSQVQ